ncbi:MAG: hypothetical protein L0G99_11215 [Propionibacteriales bacterium]|nr:hypothetical protein [Propionibacteriales bacterium]
MSRLFRRGAPGRKRTGGTAARRADTVDDLTRTHLQDFVASRRGVEAFVEAPTTMNKTSLLLIAHDGEWTRRTVTSQRWGREFAKAAQIPVYEAGVVGYPQRMRDWNSRQKD